MGHARLVPGSRLLGRCAREADGAAVAHGRGLAVDRHGDREHAGRRAPEHAVAVDHPRRHAERTEHRVVEGLRAGEVVGADHDVGEHGTGVSVRSSNA